MNLKFRNAILIAAFAGLAAGCTAETAPVTSTDLPALGLMGTIPIYWGESAGIEESLSDGPGGHWAREVLERSFVLHPMDALDKDSLASVDDLLLAQPRALTPAENVALDDWVQAGGRLLLFADPMMTGESRFPIGDRRRPQDVILLSPILKRWGLGLQFDAELPEGVQLVSTSGPPIPVNRPGLFTIEPGEGHCAISAKGMLAECEVGKGRVVVLSDAALLDINHVPAESPVALEWLLAEAFQERGK